MTNRSLNRSGLVTSAALLMALLASAAPAHSQSASLTVLHNFPSYGTDGQNPLGVVVGPDGSLYGATQAGGTGTCSEITFGGSGCGTVFQLTPPSSPAGDWTESVLYSFTDVSGDGAFPNNAVLGAGGELYGTTAGGGAYGLGAAYQLTPPAVSGGAWTEQIVYSFPALNGSSQEPGGLTVGPDGILYGDTTGGGNGSGSIFTLTPPAVPGDMWTYADIYDFSGTDGAFPNEGLIFDAMGNLYGTTVSGGNHDHGTAFELSPPATAGNPWTLTTLHTFHAGRADGSIPLAGLTLGKAGKLYGSTQSAGASHRGVIFELEPPHSVSGRWREKLIYSFTGGADGSDPGALFFVNDSTLYGLTTEGGDSGCDPHQGSGGCGTLFSLTSSAGVWTETTLETFTGPNGAQPNSPLVQGARREYFGTTYLGGSNAACAPVNASYPCGTVFKFVP